MDYCIKCDVQLIHKEKEDICPNCGWSSIDDEAERHAEHQAEQERGK